MNKTTAYTCARLQSGQIVRLEKECECRTHSGPHWLHVAESCREYNRATYADNPRALAAAEIPRLQELRRAMECEKIAHLLTDEDVITLRAAGEAVTFPRGVRRHVLALVRSYSLAEMERMHNGRLYWQFLALWEWCAPRMGGRAGDKHEAFWAHHGRAAYYARINKVRAACGFAPLANT